MEEKDLFDIISQGENEEIEFKEDLGNIQSIARTLCAFGNSNGGIVLVGVSDDGKINGIKSDFDKIQQKITSIAENIFPKPSINIQNVELDEKFIVAVIIQSAYQNSYFTYKGAVYVRIGSTTRRLEGQSQLEFLRRKRILTFDEGMDHDFSLDNIDPDKVSEYMSRKGHRAYLDTHGMKNFLLNSMLAVNTAGLRIKNAAVLLFGREPTRFFPQAEIKMVRFLGIEPVRILDHQLIQNDLMNSIEMSISFILRNIRRSLEIEEGIERKEVYEYPEKVFREAIVNAVVHRDYFSPDSIQVSIFDDRIEILNPGSLPGSLNRELFGYISVQRNPIIYRFLRNIGYVEGYGTGIPRMRNWMREAGLRDPVFTITNDFFRVTLFNASAKINKNGSSESLRQERIMKALGGSDGIKSNELVEIIGVSTPTVVKDLNDLINKDLVERIGRYRGATYRLKR
jgi:ATP-dependent DNA helicase RecG